MSMSYDKKTALRFRDFFIKNGMTLEGAYGMMANIYAESGFISINLQQTGNRALGLSDKEYTEKVDKGEYTNFVKDGYGFGICQWTYFSRKQNLLNYSKKCKVSIGDETMQLNFLMQELKGGYKAVLNYLSTPHTVEECTKYVMLKFERPANQTEAAQNKRVSYGLELFNDLETKIDNTIVKTDSGLEIRQCILTNNDCYKQGRKIKPTGIVVHSTGANNAYLKRYVQPNDGLLGVNAYNNHWNTKGVQKCVHAFIGKDVNGEVRIYQTLPWDYRCWGCGSGKKGSYNNGYIQFEICEDALTDKKYFDTAFDLAIKLCAYLSKLYNIPTENIVSHQEAYQIGYATNHADCDCWLKKFGKNMTWFRNNVSEKLGVKSVPLKINQSKKDIQKFLNTYYGTEIKKVLGSLLVIDGSIGSKSKKALAVAFQVELNKLKAGLVVDGSFGKKSEMAFDKYVGTLKQGMKNNIFVMLWQCVLVGYDFDPRGIDGSYGVGCLSATKNLFIKFNLPNDSTVSGSDINKLL